MSEGRAEDDSATPQPWKPDEVIETKGRKASPFSHVKCGVRGCPECRTNTYPRWTEDGWECEYCDYIFDPPRWVTYTEWIRCVCCGERIQQTQKRCLDCVNNRRRSTSPHAAIQRYQRGGSDE